MVGDNLSEFVSIDIQKDGKNSESFPKRLHNIQWVEQLDRTGLKYGQVERQLLIQSFDNGNRLFLQYPGKESERTKRPNKYDFKPMLYDSRLNKYHENLSFPDIWASLDKLIDEIGPQQKHVMALFATMLYRIAFMSDHIEQDKGTLTIIRQYNIASNSFGREENVELPPRYTYEPRKDAVAEIESVFSKVAGMGVTEFLCYVDILIWNEDCKYYDRKRDRGNRSDWYKIGRVNTIKTIMVFIGAKIGFIPILKVFNEFGRQGIAKPDDEDIIVLCGGYISTGPKKKQ
jgi:hypothetical protein